MIVRVIMPFSDKKTIYLAGCKLDIPQNRYKDLKSWVTPVQTKSEKAKLKSKAKE